MMKKRNKNMSYLGRRKSKAAKGGVVMIKEEAKEIMKM